jgi:hypothetical protein
MNHYQSSPTKECHVAIASPSFEKIRDKRLNESLVPAGMLSTVRECSENCPGSCSDHILPYDYKNNCAAGSLMVKGRSVNNMQNGGLGCNPSPPGHDQGIQKFSPEAGFTAGLGDGITTIVIPLH